MKQIYSNISKGQAREELRQEGVDLVRQRICLLNGKDRILMSMYYLDGCSFRQIAGLLDINECNVSRRIRKITKRLLAGQYIRCLRNRQLFSSADLRIAKDYYVGGQTIRHIAEERACSYYETRRAIYRIEAILEAVEKAESRRKEREFSTDESGQNPVVMSKCTSDEEQGTRDDYGEI